MTSKERAAMQQALEALETLDCGDSYKTHNAAAVLRVALAEQAEQEPAPWKHDCAALCMNDVELWIDNCPHCGKPRTAPSEPVKQEPVAWVDAKEEGYEFHGLRELPAGKHHLYAAPVRTKDLTDDEIRAVLDKHCGDGLMAIAYAVIAADRKLNDAK